MIVKLDMRVYYANNVRKIISKTQISYALNAIKNS